MALKFIITVDTEADNQWRQDAPLSVENLKFAPRFQELCERFNFIPTYLLTYEVATDSTFMTWLKQKVGEGKADFGAHLHSWSNPPFKDEAEKSRQTFPCELAREELKAKMVTLTEAIKTNLGVAPTAFRAGRWGISDEVMSVLKELDYKVDSSVTPFINWHGLVKGAPQAMNFKSALTALYEWQGLTEVPMTIVPVPRWGFNFGPLGNKLFYKKVWGRIFSVTKVGDLEQAFKTAKQLKWPHFQFMTHSSELMPGGSIYNKTPEAVEEFYSKLEKLFTYLSAQGVRSVGLGAIAETDIKTNN